VAPPARASGAFRNYVPNNDLDSVGGDPRCVAKIRAPKLIKPVLFDAATEFLYGWHFEEGEEQAIGICRIADRLYQLGRGVDMAWARGEIVGSADLDARVAEHHGAVYRPANCGGGGSLACPQAGSLKSLEDRFTQNRKRLTTVRLGRQVQELFSQAPRPRFAAIAYESPPRYYVFELRRTTPEFAFVPWPLTHVSSLVERLRDRSCERLKEKLSQKPALIEAVFIGRKAKEADKAARIRIIPLPSIGSPHVIPSIRRVLIEIPPNCPVAATDIAWAFSDLPVLAQLDPDTGKLIDETRLTAADDLGMLRHYGINVGAMGAYRLWRTVTPAALPLEAARRRIDPGRLRAQLEAARSMPGAQIREAKASTERIGEEIRAAAAVVHGLRHAGVAVAVDAIHVQREPFESRGARAETFANGTRFSKERLWHLEIAFAEAIAGPLVIGDGRYLGLGLMAPVLDAWRDIFVFPVSSTAKVPVSDGQALVRATRRAVMACARDVLGTPGRLFSGHEPGRGGAARTGRHEHIFLAVDDSNGDGRIDRLIAAAPWACDATALGSAQDRARFDRVLSRLKQIRAGPLGIIALGHPSTATAGDPMIGPGCVWESRTRYHPTRHAQRRKDLETAVTQDLIQECLRRGLPRPDVQILTCAAGWNGGGISAHARLTFLVAVRGPLLLGKDSHQGGGMFLVVPNR
jgi:CRISPR-associated protein Csb2